MAQLFKIRVIKRAGIARIQALGRTAKGQTYVLATVECDERKVVEAVESPENQETLSMPARKPG